MKKINEARKVRDESSDDYLKISGFQKLMEISFGL